MVENPAKTDRNAKKGEEEGETWGSFGKFLAKLVLAVLIFRSFIFAPFTIPSESMLPQLANGDYLVAAKWPYGYSRLSLPLQAPLIPGRIFEDLPERGDIAIFKHPIDGTDYIKRVIALPGDTVAMENGRLLLNGEPVKKEPIGDFILPLSPNTDCHPAADTITTSEGVACRYKRFRETLPDGTDYFVLDLGKTRQDTLPPLVIPKGQLFVMGDNRDNSQDSRFAARPGGGVGLVGVEHLVGRASMILWSTDGGAEWLLPWTWFTAARWERIGTPL